MVEFVPAPSPALATILFDLAERGIQPTPLAVISRATDLGMSDSQVADLIVKLATFKHSDEASA
jgi:hypothetical protein